MFTPAALALLAAGSYAVHRWVDSGSGTLAGLPARTVVGAAGLVLLVTPLAPIGFMVASGAIVPAISGAIASGDPIGAVKTWAAGLLESFRALIPSTDTPTTDLE